MFVCGFCLLFVVLGLLFVVGGVCVLWWRNYCCCLFLFWWFVLSSVGLGVGCGFFVVSFLLVFVVEVWGFFFFLVGFCWVCVALVILFFDVVWLCFVFLCFFFGVFGVFCVGFWRDCFCVMSLLSLVGFWLVLLVIDVFGWVLRVFGFLSRFFGVVLVFFGVVWWIVFCVGDVFSCFFFCSFVSVLVLCLCLFRFLLLCGFCVWC